MCYAWNRCHEATREYQMKGMSWLAYDFNWNKAKTWMNKWCGMKEGVCSVLIEEDKSMHAARNVVLLGASRMNQSEECKKVWVYVVKGAKVTRVGFEPTPMKTTALTLRLRPLGHRVRAIPKDMSRGAVLWRIYHHLKHYIHVTHKHYNQLSLPQLHTPQTLSQILILMLILPLPLLMYTTLL